MKMIDRIDFNELANIVEINYDNSSEYMNEIRRKAKIFQSSLIHDYILHKVIVNETDYDIRLFVEKHREFKEFRSYYNKNIEMIPMNQFIEGNYKLCDTAKQLKKRLIEHKQHMADDDKSFDDLFVYEDLYYITIYKLFYKKDKNKSNE